MGKELQDLKFIEKLIWQALVNITMKLKVPQTVRNFLNTFTIIRFSRSEIHCVRIR